MEDRELYQHLLGLTSPWTVSQVTLDTEAEEIVESKAVTFSSLSNPEEIGCIALTLGWR